MDSGLFVVIFSDDDNSTRNLLNVKTEIKRRILTPNDALHDIEQYIKQSDGLIVLLTENTISKPQCVTSIQKALLFKKQVVLVYDVQYPFPSASQISTLPVDVLPIFDSVAVPLIDVYASFCWTKICDKLTGKVKPPQQLNWFLSHYQKTGQGIALSLFHELAKLNETAFLDIKSEFDLHDLEKCVNLADYFVFILTEGIFQSEWCLKELQHALQCNKRIVILRDINFKFSLADIPKHFPLQHFPGSSRVIVYSPYFLSECAIKLKDIRTNPDDSGNLYVTAEEEIERLTREAEEIERQKREEELIRKQQEEADRLQTEAEEIERQNREEECIRKEQEEAERLKREAEEIKRQKRAKERERVQREEVHRKNASALAISIPWKEYLPVLVAVYVVLMWYCYRPMLLHPTTH